MHGISFLCEIPIGTRKWLFNNKYKSASGINLIQTSSVEFSFAKFKSVSRMKFQSTFSAKFRSTACAGMYMIYGIRGVCLLMQFCVRIAVQFLCTISCTRWSSGNLIFLNVFTSCWNRCRMENRHPKLNVRISYMESYTRAHNRTHVHTVNNAKYSSNFFIFCWCLPSSSFSSSSSLWSRPTLPRSAEAAAATAAAAATPLKSSSRPP